MCLRILHIVGIMNRGGLETWLMNLYRAIDRDKIQFDFIVHSRQKGDYDQEIKALGGKIFYIPHYQCINHFTYVKEWNNFFHSHPEYPIIHGHMRSTAAIYLKIAKRYGRIAIAHSHGTASRGKWHDKLVKGILQYPIRYTADYFFACSKEAGIWLFGKKICAGDKFHIVCNAIDTGKFTFSPEVRDRKRKELNVEGDFVIGHVGNFDRLKNHPFLIDLFDSIAGKEPTCCLFLIGEGNSTLQNQTKEKVRKKGLTGKVKFLGRRDDVNELLNAFDIFVLPSLHEGLPLVAVEAQTNSLACILSDTISKDIAITQNVEFISLKKPKKFWCDRILSYKENYKRKDMQKTIQNAGYDINGVAKWIMQFYLSLN